MEVGTLGFWVGVIIPLSRCAWGKADVGGAGLGVFLEVAKATGLNFKDEGVGVAVEFHGLVLVPFYITASDVKGEEVEVAVLVDVFNGWDVVSCAVEG